MELQAGVSLFPVPPTGTHPGWPRGEIPVHPRMTELLDNRNCFVCGKDNPSGLAVDFTLNSADRSISAVFRPTDAHQGFIGVVHGGVLASLLDEAMVKLAFMLGMNAVTAEMTVRFKAPASPREPLQVMGRIVHETKRLVRAEAKVLRGATVIAEAEGKLIKIGSI